VAYALLWFIPLCEIWLVKRYKQYRKARLLHELARDRLEALAWYNWKCRFRHGTTVFEQEQTVDLKTRGYLRALDGLRRKLTAGEITSREYKFLRLDILKSRSAAR